MLIKKVGGGWGDSIKMLFRREKSEYYLLSHLRIVKYIVKYCAKHETMNGLGCANLLYLLTWNTRSLNSSDMLVFILSENIGIVVRCQLSHM